MSYRKKFYNSHFTMNWNWEKSEWANFVYDIEKIRPLEERYIRLSGEFKGVLKHISLKQKNQIIIYLLSTEAVETSSIEGEVLDRNSVQSSIQRHLGLNPDLSKSKPQESGIAAMMMDVFQNFEGRLTEEKLHAWNRLINRGRDDLEFLGNYRKDTAPMQIVSGPYGHQKIHFEAPPSAKVPGEMENFVTWFNQTESYLSPLVRASLAHLYFVSIHPYEDGNGRISRALVEKSLSQYQGMPALTNISREIQVNQKHYYQALSDNNQDLELTDWILYLGEIILKAQAYTLKKVECTIEKTKLYDRFEAQLNQRQIKVIERLFESEPEGFEGGLSAENYIRITKTSRATATRDLQKLVEIGVLSRSGERRHTRYFLAYKN